MKKWISILVCLTVFTAVSQAQRIKDSQVPAPVKAALQSKYPDSRHVTWEKENGNFEANWGGRSGEDNSVQFSPAGKFIEQVKAIPITQLPPAAVTYIKLHYKGAPISEAGRVTDARGKIRFEAEVKRKDLLFDEDGKFISAEK
jgi:Putative beta-lactamase-inhibitor-like, PepSY-like